MGLAEPNRSTIMNVICLDTYRATKQGAESHKIDSEGYDYSEALLSHQKRTKASSAHRAKNNRAITRDLKND